jgi:hypothetical protein
VQATSRASSPCSIRTPSFATMPRHASMPQQRTPARRGRSGAPRMGETVHRALARAAIRTAGAHQWIGRIDPRAARQAVPGTDIHLHKRQSHAGRGHWRPCSPSRARYRGALAQAIRSCRSLALSCWQPSSRLPAASPSGATSGWAVPLGPCRRYRVGAAGSRHRSTCGAAPFIRCSAPRLGRAVPPALRESIQRLERWQTCNQRR